MLLSVDGDIRLTPARLLQSAVYQRAVLAAKQIWYAGRGEPFSTGQHVVRYLPGTRPTRIQYANSSETTARNDARQILLLRDSVKPGDFIVDVGGNVGQYAVLLAALVGENGMVVTFDPSPEARLILKKNLELNAFSDRVKVESIALFDRKGSHSFYTRGEHAMASLERAGFGTTADATDIDVTTVSTTTLDEYLAEQKLPAPAWVKIDAEGAEINILRGASNTLRKGSRIICELHPYAWPAFGTTFGDLRAVVQASGRTMRPLDTTVTVIDASNYGCVIIE